MNRYRVVLTHAGREWRGEIDAENVDQAIKTAKDEHGFPERTTSETQRIDSNGRP